MVILPRASVFDIGITARTSGDFSPNASIGRPEESNKHKVARPVALVRARRNDPGIVNNLNNKSIFIPFLFFRTPRLS
jgi:hypothetical protein